MLRIWTEIAGVDRQEWLEEPTLRDIKTFKGKLVPVIRHPSFKHSNPELPAIAIHDPGIRLAHDIPAATLQLHPIASSKYRRVLAETTYHT